MLHNSLSQQAQALADKSISSVELTQSYLDRIETIDPKLNSFITVNSEQALKQAENADKLRQQGQSNPLLGIPIAHKDIFCTQGVKTSCASKMLDNFIAPYNATVIEKFNTQGAVLLGKTNMDEFAMGSSSESSFYGPTLNPWSDQHVPGGSSGGSAAAVAAGLCSAATGTDTGGSIRQPAAYCGLTGLKPTYGRVSRWGMIAYASSLDQGGPLTRSAEDAAIMLQAMAGFDEKDSTSVRHPVADYQAELNKPLTGLKIGIARDYFNQSLNPELAASIEQAAQLLQSLGASLQDVGLPNTDAGIPAYYIIAPAEASTNLSRYDGVRFGYRCDNPKNLDDLYLRSRSEGFGEEVKRRIMVGTYALSAGFYDAYYRKAQKIRRLIKQDFVSAFNQVDVILSPITANTAFKLGEKNADPVSMYKEDIYSIIANLAGIPALSLPIGQLNSLPVSMQLMGNYFDEARLLNIGHAFQQNSEFHLARPEV